MRKLLGSAACVAALAGLAALPAAATASRANDCGVISGEQNGVEYGASISADGIKCGNGYRVARKCLVRGALVDGWGVRYKTSRGVLKLKKGHKTVFAALAGAQPPGLEACLQANDGL